MPYFYLLISVCCAAGTNVLGAYHNRKNDSKTETSSQYNLLLAIAAFLAWMVMYCFDSGFHWKVLPYSFAFGAFYTLCNVGYIQALKSGPASLTSLFVSLALLAVTVWGFIFWDAPVETIGIVGIVLSAASIVLCLYEGKKKDEKGFSWKWLFWAAMAFVGNAGCTIAQKTQQMDFNGKYASGLMMYALLFSVIVNLVIWLRSDTSDGKRTLKKFGIYPVAAGVSNFALNIFIILLAGTTLSPAIIYPVVGVGALMLTTLFSVIGLREKLKWWQWIGMAIGASAILLLSL